MVNYKVRDTSDPTLELCSMQKRDYTETVALEKISPMNKADKIGDTIRTQNKLTCNTMPF